MTTDPERLKTTIAALATHADDKFIDLGRALRALQEVDPGSFATILDTTAIGRRRGYYLVSISRAFDGLPVADARLAAIGWTKLQIIAPHVDADNVAELLSVAENCTAHELQGLADDMPRVEEHCILLRMTKADYGLFVSAMVAYGAVRRGRGLSNKEEALRRLMTAALGSSDLPKA